MSMSITRRKERKAVRTGTSIVVRHLLGIAVMWAPGLVNGETLTLQQAIERAQANNRAIRAARLERAKALTEVNGDIDAALISVPHSPKAINLGMKVLVRTGDYIQRAGGTFWARKAYADQNPETLKKFIRATAKGVMYYRDDKAGSLPVLREHLGIDNDTDAGIVWDQTHNTFGAELPKRATPRSGRPSPSMSPGTRNADGSNQRSIFRCAAGRFPSAMRSGRPPTVLVFDVSKPSKEGLKNWPV